MPWTPSRGESGRGAVDQLLERTLLQVLVEAPALHLLEYLVKFGARDRLVYKALAPAEAAVVPLAVLEFGGYAVLPQRQIARQVGLERALGAVQGAKVTTYAVPRRGVRHPPERVELVRDDLPQPQLLGHVDLRRQKARGFDLPVEKRGQARAEAADVDGLDVLERKIFLQAERNVEMAARAHPDPDGNVLEVGGAVDAGLRADEDRP